MNVTLSTLRDSLGAISGVASCKVGLEKRLNPSDYPMIRIVPERIEAGRPYQHRTVRCIVFFAVKRLESELGLEQVYSELMTMERSIIDAMTALGHKYVETQLNDQDVDGQYKIAAIIADVIGAE